MYAYKGDVLWGNGRDGGYLVLGNIVYTVSGRIQVDSIYVLYLFNFAFYFSVCRGYSLFESRSDY